MHLLQGADRCSKTRSASPSAGSTHAVDGSQRPLSGSRSTSSEKEEEYNGVPWEARPTPNPDVSCSTLTCATLTEHEKQNRQFVLDPDSVTSLYRLQLKRTTEVLQDLGVELHSNLRWSVVLPSDQLTPMERFLEDEDHYMVGTRTQECHTSVRKTLLQSDVGSAHRCGSNGATNRREDFNAEGPSSQFSED